MRNYWEFLWIPFLCISSNSSSGYASADYALYSDGLPESRDYLPVAQGLGVGAVGSGGSAGLAWLGWNYAHKEFSKEFYKAVFSLGIWAS